MMFKKFLILFIVLPLVLRAASGEGNGEGKVYGAAGHPVSASAAWRKAMKAVLNRPRPSLGESFSRMPMGGAQERVIETWPEPLATVGRGVDRESCSSVTVGDDDDLPDIFHGRSSAIPTAPKAPPKKPKTSMLAPLKGENLTSNKHWLMHLYALWTNNTLKPGESFVLKLGGIIKDIDTFNAFIGGLKILVTGNPEIPLDLSLENTPALGKMVALDFSPILGNLKALSISNCALITFELNAPGLTILDLRNNPLRSLPELTAPKLETLYLPASVGAVPDAWCASFSCIRDISFAA